MAEAASAAVTDGAAAGAELEQRLEKSERALAIERASAAEANRRASTSAAEAERLRARVTTTETTAVASTISALQAEKDNQISQYEQLLADGEFRKAAELQFKMAETATKLTSLNSYKDQQDAAAKAPKPDAQGFDKEKFITSQTPATAAWLREHDAYFTDAKINKAVTGAAQLAEARGIAVDSPEYFEFVERESGITPKPDDGGNAAPRREASVPRAAEQRRGPAAAAPSRESGFSPREVRQGDVYIPPEMIRAAEICDITPQQYYDGYVADYKAGKISDHMKIFTR